MLKMKFILPIFLIQMVGADAAPRYENLINFHEKENAVFVNPISSSNEEPVSYEELRMQAILNCKNIKNVSSEDEKIIDDLIEIEQGYNVPKELRGMLLAAACQESGFDPFARGDHRFSKSKKKAMAIGILQMWPWWEKSRHGYGIDRTDYKAAAHAWMSHITSRLPKVKKTCSYKTPERLGVAAWVTAIRAPKDGGRCSEKPLHLALLKKWHRLIKVDRNFNPG